MIPGGELNLIFKRFWYVSVTFFFALFYLQCDVFSKFLQCWHLSHAVVRHHLIMVARRHLTRRGHLSNIMYDSIFYNSMEWRAVGVTWC